jgi:hypothetical protein
MRFQRSSGVLMHISSLPSTAASATSAPKPQLPRLPRRRQAAHLAGPAALPHRLRQLALRRQLRLRRQSLPHQPRIPLRLGLDRRPHRRPRRPQRQRRLRRRRKPQSSRCSTKPPATSSTAAPTKSASKASGSASPPSAPQEASWLNDYAYYAVFRRHFKTGAWTAWPEPLRRREPAAMAEAATQFGHDLAVEQVLQFAFEEQWRNLRAAAAKRKIRILGDIAIFVSMDSADVWANPHLFELDEDLKPIRVAGVPPDYFSPTGQRWGNPLYRWDVLAETGYAWWIQRIRRSCMQYDIVRLDHFRGFEAYWSIPQRRDRHQRRMGQSPRPRALRPPRTRPRPAAARRRRPRPHHP